jgi:hypothetical protein
VTPDDLLRQAEVLERASADSTMGVYIGLLNSRAKELRATAKAAREADGDRWSYDLVPAAGLEAGIPVWDPSYGPVTVRRVSRGGLGIECENDSGFGEPIVWINPLAPTSLIVVLGARREHALAEVEHGHGVELHLDDLHDEDLHRYGGD